MVQTEHERLALPVLKKLHLTKALLRFGFRFVRPAKAFTSFFGQYLVATARFSNHRYLLSSKLDAPNLRTRDKVAGPTGFQ